MDPCETLNKSAPSGGDLPLPSSPASAEAERAVEPGEISEEDFQSQVLESTQPVLVDTAAFPADFLAVGNGVLAVSEGNGVFFFDLGPLDDPTPVIQPEILPHKFALQQNYPNPFNLETTISFELERRSHVDLSIFNILGQRVTTLIDRPLAAGRHQVAWDGRQTSGKVVATGVYVYRLQTDRAVEARKMVLLK